MCKYIHDIIALFQYLTLLNVATVHFSLVICIYYMSVLSLHIESTHSMITITGLVQSKDPKHMGYK